MSGETTAECPHRPGTITVQVMDKDWKEIQNAKVTLTGKTSGEKPTNPEGFAVWEKVTPDPANGYSVQVAIDHLPAYKDHEIRYSSKGPKCDTSPSFPMPPGGDKSMTFGVHPPVTELVVRVIDADKRTPVTKESFQIKLSGASTEERTAGHGEAKGFKVDAGKSYGAELVLTPEQQNRYTFSPPARLAIKRGSANLIEIVLKEPVLRLVSVDPHFAPSAEPLEIKYDIRHRQEAEVRLQILGPGDAVLYTRPLSPAEKADGQNVISWDGKTNRAAGAFQDGQYIDPVGGPYKVVLDRPGTNVHRGELPFAVLIHSIKLEVVEWDELYRVASNADPRVVPGLAEDPKIKMWVAYKLNELGFWAGPIEGTSAVNPWLDLEKAIRRFRLMHPELSGWKKPHDAAFYRERKAPNGSQQELYFDETIADQLTNIDQPLVDALKDPKTKSSFARTLLSEPAALLDGTKTTKLFIDNHRFQISESTEFNGDPDVNSVPDVKRDREGKWLSRPHLPLRTRVLLKSKTKDAAAVSAPDATGAVPIIWSWSDEPEPLLRTRNIAPALPARSREEPSTTQLFIDQTLNAVCADPTRKRHTTPVTAGGILLGNDEDAGRPFAQCHALKDAKYTLNTAATPTRPMGVVAQAYVGEAGKTGRKADAQGKINGKLDPAAACSVVYFCPSMIAGDNYRIKAQIDPELTDVTDPLLKAETGRIVVWRRAFVAAFVGWPLRGAKDDDGNTFVLEDELKKAAREFEPSFFDLDLSKMKSYPIEDVFSNEDYQTVFFDNPGMDQFVKDQGKKYMGIVGSGAATKSFPKDSLYPGDPEDIEPRKAFNDAFTRFSGCAKLITDIKSKFTADPAPEGLVKQASTVMRAVAGWKDSALEANVRSAASALHTVLATVLEPDGALPWKFKPHNSGTIAALATPGTFATSKLTAAELDEMLIPPPMRDEIAAYAKTRTYTAASQSFMKEWLGWTEAARRAAEKPLESLEGSFLKMFMEKLAVIYKDGLKGDAPLFQRDHLLGLRAWVLRNRLAGFGEAARVKLSWHIDLAGRRKLARDAVAADGLVLLDYQLTKPMTINGRPFRVDGFAFGGPNGIVLLDQGLITQFHSLVAHEIAHCMFLHHWVNTNPTVMSVHDHNDDNCLMSYPYPFKKEWFTEPAARSFLDFRFPKKPIKRSLRDHYCYDVFKPHFCGKCNLQIRGWNIRANGVPDQATLPTTPAPPQKPVTVRFIKGDVPDAEKNASALTAAGISYYPIDRAGELKVGWNQFRIESLPKFPTAFGYNADAAKDPNAFRVEVLDENTQARSVFVMLEALKPDKTSFPGDERRKRCLVNVECQEVEPGRYRSRYIRLVVDEVDREALYATKQGLLVTDMADGTDGDADKIEILDQKVRVIYDPTP